MLHGILRLLEALVNDSWTGKFLASSMAVTLLACGTLLVATLMRRQRRWLWLGALIASGITVLLAGANIALSRIDLLALLTPGSIPADLDPSQRARLVAEAYSRTTNTRQLAGVVVGAAMAVLALSNLRDQPMRQRARLELVCVGAVLLASIATIARETRLLSGLGNGHSDPDDKAVALMEVMNYANQAFTMTKPALVALAIVGAVWLSLHAVRDATRGAYASNLGVLCASALLVLGVVAYVGTRAHAHDAYHLLPPIKAGPCDVDEKLLPLLPLGPVQECGGVPLVQFLLDLVTVDRNPVSDPLELENVLRRKCNLWHEINPGREDASLTIGIAAADGQNAASMLPWLEAVKRSGFKRVGALYTIAPKPVSATATIGTLTRERCCFQLITGMPTKEEPNGVGSWGELVRSARATPASTLAR